MIETASPPIPLTEQPYYKALWDGARKVCPVIDPDIVGLVDAVNNHVDAYNQSTGDYSGGINPTIYAPLYQDVKNRLAAKGRDTDRVTIVLTAALEADEHMQALAYAPKYDHRTMTASQRITGLGKVGNILNWLDKQNLASVVNEAQ